MLISFRKSYISIKLQLFTIMKKDTVFTSGAMITKFSHTIDPFLLLNRSATHSKTKPFF